MSSSDVVIIGGGVIGASIAYRLSLRGYAVTVIDSSAPGAGASGACDQSIFLQSKRPGLHMRLAIESRRMYDSLEDELESSLEFSAQGGMVAIENETQWEFMHSFVAQQRRAGIEVDLLEHAQALDVQPRLSPSILGASYSPLDAEVSPLLLNVAFLRAAERQGAQVIRGVEMFEAIRDGDAIRGIVTSVGRMYADLVINAAGPYAGIVGDRAGISTPISPRRGTILITEPVPRQVSGVLLSAQYVAAKHLASEPGSRMPHGIGLSLGQTGAGNLLIGGSREFRGFSKEVTSSVFEGIARHAVAIVPSLRNHRIIRTMTGFRPFTGDGLPIIEMTCPGWLTAAGHEGDGIALAPITGQLVVDLLDGHGPTHHFLDALSGQRSTLQRLSAPAPGVRPATVAATAQNQKL